MAEAIIPCVAILDDTTVVNGPDVEAMGVFDGLWRD